jgi:hypothetical protein
MKGSYIQSVYRMWVSLNFADSRLHLDITKRLKYLRSALKELTIKRCLYEFL